VCDRRERAFEKRHTELEAQTGFCRAAIHSRLNVRADEYITYRDKCAFVNYAFARAHVRAYVLSFLYFLQFKLRHYRLASLCARKREREASQSLVALSNCWLIVLLRLYWADYAQRENGAEVNSSLIFSSRLNTSWTIWTSLLTRAKSHGINVLLIGGDAVIALCKNQARLIKFHDSFGIKSGLIRSDIKAHWI